MGDYDVDFHKIPSVMLAYLYCITPQFLVKFYD